jgi:uncharacterized membrane protein YcaP (DUF421 family)
MLFTRGPLNLKVSTTPRHAVAFQQNPAGLRTPPEESTMFDLSIPVHELIVRPTIIYVFLFIGFRWMGKKHIGELAPFDLIVLLIISETVQNAMIGGDKSVVGGLICSATLLILTQLMNWANRYSKKTSRFLEGTPKVLVWHGKRLPNVMRNERVSIAELMEALRHKGIANIRDVQAAVLENDGKISVIEK